MPTILDRARNTVANALIGDKLHEMQGSFRTLYEAYMDGPFVLPPEQLVAQLKEQSPDLLIDLVRQLEYEQLSVLGYGVDTSAERKRAVDEARRLAKYNPLVDWSIKVWTSYGLGESVKITCKDSDANVDFQECWTADRNPIFAADRIHDLSRKLLVTGERFLVHTASTLDGECTIRNISPDEITEIIAHPDDKSMPLFYKRQWQSGAVQQTLYYPDWQAFFDDALDKDYKDGKTLAEFVLPSDARRSDRLNGMTIQLESNKTSTVAIILHIAHNLKDENDPRGWPITACSATHVREQEKHIRNRRAVSAAKAMYVREIVTSSGSRGVDAIKSKLASKLDQDNWLDRNPPAAPGSNLIHNQAVEHKDLPVSTGASDAKTDNDLFTWFPLIGMGLYPSTAGLDVMRYATALAMDKTQAMQWTNYQTFWSAQFKKIVKIVLKFKEKYKNKTYQTMDAHVSIDSLSMVDFPEIVTSVSNLFASALTPLVDNGTIPQRAARSIAARIWAIVLQALGVLEPEELTSDIAFEIEPMKVTDAMQAAVERFKSKKITGEQLAEFLIAELIEHEK